ncbi:ribosome recycling factor [Candidatus Pantoea edessiphila]|uniref:Ribosome-recycling factor n=1 Tax=Candidatus Pantoea edessiphila TaxID=2044610 RepID=A0A2P5SY07_9GAMM|nr:ribosome recycling factor [Candidatus Pantoea edessiphila]MBK4775566.1 ribosome recycling factor [Pantoea sp. Edef]PPI87219.1 ribosome recycling factor [Candidatus Pantoea edessiphila]
MINDIKKDTEVRMVKCINLFTKIINKIRTGRAATTLLDSIMVNYYGSLTPIYKLSNINVENSRTLKINVFDSSIVASIKNAIKASDLGLNPLSEGDNIYVPIPTLTEERRKELIKIVRNTAEQSRVSIRNIRRDNNDKIRIMLKEKTIGEDDEHNLQQDIQKITSKYIAQIDVLLSKKENELMKF